MYKRLQISGLITHVQADVISVEAIPMALREHLLQTPSVLTNQSSSSSKLSNQQQEPKLRDNRRSKRQHKAMTSSQSNSEFDESKENNDLYEEENDEYTEIEEDEEEGENDQVDEEEDERDNVSESNSSLVIEPSNILTNEDVLAMPDLRDVLQTCHHPNQYNRNSPGAEMRPKGGEMVVLVDETYEFGECENCMEDEDEEDDDEDDDEDEDDEGDYDEEVDSDDYNDGDNRQSCKNITAMAKKG